MRHAWASKTHFCQIAEHEVPGGGKVINVDKQQKYVSLEL